MNENTKKEVDEIVNNGAIKEEIKKFLDEIFEEIIEEVIKNEG